MKNKVIGLGALCLLFASVSLTAQEQTEKTEKLEEVVVVATKFATEKEKIGKIIYKITEADLENMQGKTVVEVLNNLAGIHIKGTNNVDGEIKGMYIRGGRGYQNLVLIDGVPLYDPTGITAEFDLRLLNLNQIESIEVMNGAASTLYGSGAATGVINIKLKKSADKPISMNYQTSVGSNNSQENRNSNLNDINQNISVNGTLNKFTYLASLNASLERGLSSASDENSETPFTDDPFQATNVYARLGYNFSSKFNIGIFGNFDKNVFDFDEGRFADSEINNGDNRQYRYGLTSDFIYNKGSLKLIASFNQNDRIINQYSSWTNTINTSEYNGESLNIDLYNEYKFNNALSLITGVNYQDFSNETNTPWSEISPDLANYNMVDPYATLVYSSKSGFNINGGARLNIHSEYGSHLVYNINPSYNFNSNFRLLASYSTAYIAPSTYQLFSQYGNLDLKPEEDATVEAGLEYGIQKKFNLNAVFFYREVENAFIWEDGFYQNVSETTNAKGVEAQLNIDALKVVDFVLGYTYTHKSADLDYIPKNKFTALAQTSSIKNTYFSLQFMNVSKRTYYDQYGSGEIIDLDAYNLLDFFGRYTIIKDRLSVFGSLNNIFNSDYVETIGYTTKGRNFKIGLDFSF